MRQATSRRIVVSAAHVSIDPIPSRLSDTLTEDSAPSTGSVAVADVRRHLATSGFLALVEDPCSAAPNARIDQR
jgi:hypothetical protein